MSVRIAVIAEAEADRRQVCEMVDRKIRDHAPDWWDESQIETERTYCGLAPNTLFTRWRELRDLPAPQWALRRGGLIGFGKGSHLHFDYALGRKAVLCCALAKPRVDAVILMRDMDQQPKERTASLERVKMEVAPSAFRVVLALPTAKREAWVLNGFEPDGNDEKVALDTIRRELSFDPLRAAEELSAMKIGAKRDAKRVVKHLMGHDPDRERRCWSQTAWTVLRERGKGSGLSQFLTDVKEQLVPLVTGQSV